MERDMLERGAIAAIAFSSQAEVAAPLAIHSCSASESRRTAAGSFVFLSRRCGVDAAGSRCTCLSAQSSLLDSVLS